MPLALAFTGAGGETRRELQRRRKHKAKRRATDFVFIGRGKYPWQKSRAQTKIRLKQDFSVDNRTIPFWEIHAIFKCNGATDSELTCRFQGAFVPLFLPITAIAAILLPLPPAQNLPVPRCSSPIAENTPASSRASLPECRLPAPVCFCPPQPGSSSRHPGPAG